jgi:hypothetical protein
VALAGNQADGFAPEPVLLEHMLASAITERDSHFAVTLDSKPE